MWKYAALCNDHDLMMMMMMTTTTMMMMMIKILVTIMIIIKQYWHLGENHIGIGARHAVHGSCDGFPHECGKVLTRCRPLLIPVLIRTSQPSKLG